MPDVSNPPGLTESGDVDHDETSNRTHDGDDLSPATLEASNSITDPSGTSHTVKLAASSDVSTIQSSGDVTVTETQPGSVNNGEFLTNSGGNLTGGTVETEPNVPNWQEDPNSPFTANSTDVIDINLQNTYDFWMVNIEVSDAEGREGEIKMQSNNVTSGYEYKPFRSTDTTFSSQINGITDVSSNSTSVAMVMIRGVWKYASFINNIITERDTMTEYAEAGDVTNDGSLDKITLFRESGPERTLADWKVTTYGLNV